MKNSEKPFLPTFLHLQKDDQTDDPLLVDIEYCHVLSHIHILTTHSRMKSPHHVTPLYRLCPSHSALQPISDGQVKEYSSDEPFCSKFQLPPRPWLAIRLHKHVIIVLDGPKNYHFASFQTNQSS